MCYQYLAKSKCLVNLLNSLILFHSFVLLREPRSSKRPQKYPRGHEVSPWTTALFLPCPSNPSGADIPPVGPKKLKGVLGPFIALFLEHPLEHGLLAPWGAEVRLYLGGTAASHCPSYVTGF